MDAREYYHAHRAAINARNRERRAANPDELRARDRKYYQSSHAKRLEDARRYYKKHKDDPKFKARNVANAKQYRQRYPQKTKEIITRAKALYRIRLRNAEGTHTMAEWRAILARYGNKCLCCGATENISLDHIIGLASGGTNFATNLQPLCVSCNTSKQAKYIDFRPDAYWGDWL